VIVIDTHIWYWWAHTPGRLAQPQIQAIEANSTDVIGVSAFPVGKSQNVSNTGGCGSLGRLIGG